MKRDLSFLFSRDSVSTLPFHPTTSSPPISNQSYIKIKPNHLITNPSSQLDLLLFPLFTRHIKIQSRSLNTPFSVTLKPYHGDPVRLPAWVFDYWVEVGCVVNIQKQWKAALTWVHKQSISPMIAELCHHILLGLSSLSWSQSAAYTCDITPLLSNTSVESYLSSFHIDHVIAQTKVQYKTIHGPKITNCHILATVDHFNAILHFYGNIHARK